eukprot:1937775-Amphidinium_carterae.1
MHQRSSCHLWLQLAHEPGCSHTLLHALNFPPKRGGKQGYTSARECSQNMRSSPKSEQEPTAKVCGFHKVPGLTQTSGALPASLAWARGHSLLPPLGKKKSI